MIKIFIVDDSTFVRKTLRYFFSFDKELEVVGEAGDGNEAMKGILATNPDVVTMDIIMPGVDGLWALEEIMKQKPTPVVIMSSVGLSSSDVVKEAFSMGVVDVISKPENPKDLSTVKNDLIEKVKAAAKVNKFRLLEYKSKYLKQKITSRLPAREVVVIATSAGGPTSLYEVIQRLSDNFSAGVVVAQHMPAQFISSFVDHIQNLTSLDVKVAEKGDLLYSRRVLFSPTIKTLEINKTKKGAVAELVDLKIRLQPEIDEVILSCAKAFKASVVLVVLSGLGDSSARGAEAVKKNGGRVIVEDESTAGVFSGMPSSVVKTGNYDVLCPSYSIADNIEAILSKNKATSTNQKTKQFLIKGVLIKNTVDTLKKINEGKLFKQIAATLSPETREILEKDIRVYNYYSSNLYCELFQSINDHASSTNPKLMTEIAIQNIKETLETYKATLTLTSISDISRFLPGFNKVAFPGLKTNIQDLKISEKRLGVVFRSEGFTNENTKIYSTIIQAWLAGFLDFVGLRILKSSVDINSDEKGLYHRYIIEW